MAVTLKLKIDDAGLKKIILAKKRLIAQNIRTVFEQEVLSQLVQALMVGYDSLSERMSVLPEDPTSPAYWRDDFHNLLWMDISKTLRTDTHGDTTKISVYLGDMDLLGYGHSEDKGDSPLIWLVYYLEGLAGEWGFITSEQSGGTFGRFGKGFLISRQAYTDEGWEARTGVSFEEIKHPFSGYSPVDIFREALDELQLRPYIQKAINASVKGVTL